MRNILGQCSSTLLPTVIPMISEGILKNDVHVGLSKNCNLECTLTLVNTFFYIHLCVAFWCKEKPKQL